MDLNSIFLGMIICINFVVFALVTWTLYEFIRLDKEQFRCYSIGLALYGITVFCFFLRYVVFPSLGTIESTILGFGVYVLPLIGVLFFIKGTEYLAAQENPDFKRNETLYRFIFYLIVITGIYTLSLNGLKIVLSKGSYNVLSYFSNILYVIIVIFSLKLLLYYKNFFSPLFRGIIFQYVLAVLFLIGGGLIMTTAFRPVTVDNSTITDLSYLRNTVATIGGFLIIIPFLICYRSVSKFRKLLTG